MSRLADLDLQADVVAALVGEAAAEVALAGLRRAGEVLQAGTEGAPRRAAAPVTWRRRRGHVRWERLLR